MSKAKGMDKNMILTNEEVKQFYNLWIPLLDFVNRKYKLISKFYGMTSPEGLPLTKVPQTYLKL